MSPSIDSVRADRIRACATALERCCARTIRASAYRMSSHGYFRGPAHMRRFLGAHYCTWSRK